MSLPGESAPAADGDVPWTLYDAELAAYETFTQVSAKLGVRRQVLDEGLCGLDPTYRTLYNPTWVSVPRGQFEAEESVVAVILSETVHMSKDEAISAELAHMVGESYQFQEEGLVMPRLSILRASLRSAKTEMTPTKLLDYQRPGVIVRRAKISAASVPVCVAPDFDLIRNSASPEEFIVGQICYRDWLGKLAAQQLT